MQILVLIGTVGASLDETIFTLYGSNDVFMRKEVPFGFRTMGDVIWGNIPPKTPEKGVNRKFKAKTAKYNKKLIRR